MVDDGLYDSMRAVSKISTQALSGDLNSFISSAIDRTIGAECTVVGDPE